MWAQFFYIGVRMAFESFSEFLNMGGHGLYVWLSYALGLAVIIANLSFPVLQTKKIERDLRRRQRREERYK